MSGQTMIDRLTAAKHSIAGHGLAKSVCKATTEEVMGPKKKHIEYLVQCTNEPNVSIPQMADLLIERTQNTNWVVVFKSLISMHNLMNYGNERFTQYLASNNCTVNLGNFLDKSGVQGYDMSTFIRRYAKYLNEKAYSYRQMAFDFCKIKRGKDDGTLRTMNGDKLLKTLPVLQNQLDALLEFDCTPNELTNGVINACFMLMFKDLIRLFACYNDGIINLLEKYFEMNKKQCKEALDLYKKFLVRMERVSEFLKVAESVGIDKGDIPDLAKAPSSLLDALEQHLASQDSSKKGEKKTKQPESVSTAISTLAASASGGPGASTVSEDEKRKILEEESRQLQMLKEEQEKAHPTNPFANALENNQEQQLLEQSTNPFSSSMNNGTVTSPSGGMDLLGAGSPTNASAAGSNSNDLLSLSGPNPFAASMVQASTAPTVSAPPPGSTDLFGPPAPAQGAGSPWGATSVPRAGSPANTATTNSTTTTTTTFASDAQFAAVFGSSNSQTTGGAMVNNIGAPPPGSSAHQMSGMSSFDALGEVMKPQGSTQAANQPSKTDQRLIQGSDLDMSLTSLASNLNINRHGQAIKKTDHQWKPTGERKLTGGMTWAQPMGPSASATFTAPGQPMQGQQPGMMTAPGQQAFATQPMAFGQPMGMQQPMGMTQGQMFGVQPGMQPQTAMFAQPRPPQPSSTSPNDPFGSL